MLTELGIKFDSTVANAIMTERPGAASKLLQQLKVKLDMGVGKAHVATRASVDRTPDAMLITTDRHRAVPEFKRMQHTMFERTIRQKVENPSDFYMAMHLKRFEDEAIRQSQQADEALRQKKCAGTGATVCVMRAGQRRRSRYRTRASSVGSGWKRIGRLCPTGARMATSSTRPRCSCGRSA